LKFRIVLSFAIRHHYQIEDEPIWQKGHVTWQNMKLLHWELIGSKLSSLPQESHRPNQSGKREVMAHNQSMRFAIAGGGVAGLAAALAVARAGHRAVVVERDPVEADESPRDAFDVERRGIPHFFQPHAFLPRGRRVLREFAPDVLDALLAAGAEPQDLAVKLRGPQEPADDDLVYLWVRRPVVE